MISRGSLLGQGYWLVVFVWLLVVLVSELVSLTGFCLLGWIVRMAMSFLVSFVLFGL